MNSVKSQKFIAALDADEARRLKEFAYKWHYDAENSFGVTLPNDLIDCTNGKLIVGRLAIFEPIWIAHWINLKKPSRYSDERTFELKQEFLELLTGNRTSLDAFSLIDTLLLLIDDNPQILERLDSIVKKWRGEPGADPVSLAVKSGHDKLIGKLKFPWADCDAPSQRKNAIWKDEVGWHMARAIYTAANCVPTLFSLEFGFSCGIRIAEKHSDPSLETLKDTLAGLDAPPTDELLQELLPMTTLWATLRTLAEYENNSWKHETELVGLRAKTTQLVAKNPQIWAESLDWILVRSSEIGQLVDTITIQFALESREIRAALENACSSEIEDVRLKARGLWTLLTGVNAPDSELARILADAAARYIDGAPMFPHPLAPMSATWIGSDGVEGVLRSGIKRACDRFASEARDQWGDIEEALVKGLVKEIESEFRNASPKLTLIGNIFGYLHPPILSIAQRPASKMLEEPIYGCDLAWLISGNVRGRFKATWVDIVQVKKSKARGSDTIKSESWQIDSKQLDDILKWSASATYWMLSSSGDIIVIPAKHLSAIRNGTGKTGKYQSFTIGYHEVRSASIPLDQYLIDLLIGQWLGSSSEEIVKFAQGESTNIRPRVIVEVKISLGQENQNR